MDYEIVTLKEKKIMGLSLRTGNMDPEMGAKIGGLWQRLFGEGLFEAIPKKVSESSIGFYSDYAQGLAGEYDVTVGCEVSSTDNILKDMVVKVIPEGHYAKFVIIGDMVEAVQKAWSEIWAMDLKRTFTGDFEEYVSMQENGECEIHIYIAVK
ncbi:MAG: AraC family transcriptional regulator [Clostridiales bacterium]|nr:AraC family transcriptional regulator [Clostridiales bacterium]